MERKKYSDKEIKTKIIESDQKIKNGGSMVARKCATLDWLVARLSTSSKKKEEKIHHGTIQPSFSSLPVATISPSLSLSCPLSFLSPLAPFSLPHHSSHVCINEHAPPPASYYPHPSIGCNGYPCSFHNPSCSRPALFHTPFSLRCFLTCPFLQCVITYIHLRFFLFLFSFLSPVAHSCSPRRQGLDRHLVECDKK